MKIKSPKVRWTAVILSVFVLNTITYYLLGPSQLKKQLLTGSFAHLTHQSDSALVRNYCLSDCPRNGPGWSADLQADEPLMKNKLGVHFILYPDIIKDDWSNYGCGMSYQTENTGGGFEAPLRLFGVTQTEILQIDHKYQYKRMAEYRWCLFFWIKTFEYVDSSDIH